MKRAVILPLIAILAVAAACEAKIGKDEAEEASGDWGNGSMAEGKSEENMFSLNAPGINIKVDIPESVRSRTNFDSDSDIIYPGAAFTGMHVEGSKSKDGRKGGVEIRFRSKEPAEKIAAWYRDPARKDFTVGSITREGDELVIVGRQKDGDDFTVRLASGDGGGTSGRLIVPAS